MMQKTIIIAQKGSKIIFATEPLFAIQINIEIMQVN
jgi:hypothetical protein